MHLLQNINNCVLSIGQLANSICWDHSNAKTKDFDKSGLRTWGKNDTVTPWTIFHLLQLGDRLHTAVHSRALQWPKFVNCRNKKRINVNVEDGQSRKSNEFSSKKKTKKLGKNFVIQPISSSNYLIPIILEINNITVIQNNIFSNCTG